MHGDVWCGRGIEECVCSFGLTKCNDSPNCKNGEKVSIMFEEYNNMLALVLGNSKQSKL